MSHRLATLAPASLILATLALAAAAKPEPTPVAAGSRDGRAGSDRGRAATTPTAAQTAREAAPVLQPLVLVLPFTGKSGAEPEWLSAGIAEFVGEGMSLVGFRVVDPDAREEALEQTGLAAESRLTLASACELGRRVGARYVVTGTWRSESSKVAFTARIIDVERLKLAREGSAAAHVSLLAPALGGIVVDVTGDAGRAPAARRDLERLATLKQDALMAWMQAAAEPDNAVSHLDAALAADPTFVRARLDLAEARLAADEAGAVPEILRPVPVDAALAHRARARVLLGRAKLALDDAAGAVAAIAEGVRLEAQPEYLLWLGEAHLAAGDREAARGLAQRILEFLPDDEHARALMDEADGVVSDDGAEEADGDEPIPELQTVDAIPPGSGG